MIIDQMQFCPPGDTDHTWRYFFSCHPGGGGATGISRAENMAAGQTLKCTGNPITEKHPSPNVNSAEVETSIFQHTVSIFKLLKCVHSFMWSFVGNVLTLHLM